MTAWRPPPPSARVGDWDYIATCVATSTPDGIVGEWVDGLPGPDVRAAAAEFAARSLGAFCEGGISRPDARICVCVCGTRRPTVSGHVAGCSPLTSTSVPAALQRITRR
jgi:hypothetical protein